MECFLLLRNATYCMKVSMSMTVEESDEGRCFSSKIRHLEKAEITHSKMITCPDIEDYLAPYKQPQMTWYKVRWSGGTRRSVACWLVCDGLCVPARSVRRWNGGAASRQTPHTCGSLRWRRVTAGTTPVSCSTAPGWCEGPRSSRSQVGRAFLWLQTLAVLGDKLRLAEHP